jgi:hypothetical protein
MYMHPSPHLSVGTGSGVFCAHEEYGFEHIPLPSVVLSGRHVLAQRVPSYTQSLLPHTHLAVSFR